MGLANLIFLTTGIFLILFGLAAMFHQNLTRWINVIGIQNPILKAIISVILGVIFIILTTVVSSPV